jgi:putative addiction module component (TIGR02574 family)
MVHGGARAVKLRPLAAVLVRERVIGLRDRKNARVGVGTGRAAAWRAGAPRLLLRGRTLLRSRTCDPASGRRCSFLGSARSTEYIPSVNFIDLEEEALKLPVGERARLAEILLESLDTLSEDEHRRLWAEEAARRDAELDADPSMGRPADEVFRDARARLR